MIKKIGLVGLVALALCVVTPLACGGGGGGGVGADFCAKFASATCAKNLACPDPMNPLPPGFNMSTCVQAFTKLCTDKQMPNQTADVNCYGATHVNAAAEMMCLAAVNATTCDQINGGMTTYDDVCSMVCGAPVVTGGGGMGGTTGSGSAGAAGSGSAGATGSGSAGTTGSGSAGTTGAGGTAPAPPDAMSFCVALSDVDCDQAFKCVPPAMRDADFMASEGTSVDECKGAITTTNCMGFADMCAGYSSLFGQACVNKYAAQTCDDISANGLPAECFFACP